MNAKNVSAADRLLRAVKVVRAVDNVTGAQRLAPAHVRMEANKYSTHPEAVLRVNVRGASASATTLWVTLDHLTRALLTVTSHWDGLFHLVDGEGAMLRAAFTDSTGMTVHVNVEVRLSLWRQLDAVLEPGVSGMTWREIARALREGRRP